MATVGINTFVMHIGQHEVTVYELTCTSGFQVQLMNWGAGVLDIRMPDRSGQIESVILGFADVNDYVDNLPYLGATIGRTAGRIAFGRYQLNGQMHQLPTTQGEHVLHGGLHAMSHQLWQHRAEALDDGRAQVIFTLQSPAGENGYSGTLSVEVRYTLDDAQRLQIDYSATTDAPTLCNLTHHSYFNLSGNAQRDVQQHQLQVHANQVCSMNEQLLVDGGTWAVDGSDFDCRQPKLLSEIVNSQDPRIELARGLDHYFVFEQADKTQTQATLFDPESGRRLRVKTDQPCTVLYTHNYPGVEHFRGGVIGRQYDSLCIETQKCPHQTCENGDHPARLLPSEQYRHSCTYAFDVANDILGE